MKIDLESLDPGDRARIERTFVALEERGVQPLFVADRQAALDLVLKLIPRGVSIAHGSSTTLREIGLVDYLSQPDRGYRYLNSEWLAEQDSQR